MMQVLSGLSVLVGVGVWVAIFAESYPVFIGRIALALYRHSRRMMLTQTRSASQLNEAWVNELERDVGDR